MNVLFITYDFPYPTNSGGKNRAYHLIKHTAKNANIFLFSFVRDDYNPEYNKEIFDLGVKDIKVFKREKLSSFFNIPKTIFNNCSIFKTLYYDKKVEWSMREFIKKNKIEVVHFESSYTGYYIGKELKRLGVRQVLGTENIEFQLYYDYASNTKKVYLKPFIKFQAGRLKNEELLMVKNADKVITITQEEADKLESFTGKKCDIVANGIEPKTFSYSFDPKIKKNILFVGNFSYFPNVDGINFFYKEAFDKLSKDLTLTVIGKDCSKILNFDDERIIKKDFVDDIISEYKKADIMVFPIRIGGGTNFKILEAMSLGIPIVANPQRLAGLNAVSGLHFLEATTGEEYAQKIELLLNDKNLREELTLQARKLIDKYYSWENIGRDLLRVWKS